MVLYQSCQRENNRQIKRLKNLKKLLTKIESLGKIMKLTREREAKNLDN